MSDIRWNHHQIHDAFVQADGSFTKMGRILNTSRRYAWELAIREGVYKKGSRPYFMAARHQPKPVASPNIARRNVTAWSQKEDAALRTLRSKQKLPVSAIMKTLGRSYDSIACRMTKLGIVIRPNHWAHKSPRSAACPSCHRRS